MTSRETLALVAVGLPALTAVVVALSPRRAVQPLALAGLVATGVAAITLGVLALASPAALEVTDWVVIDAAGGLMVGVVGIVGLASAVASPAYLAAAQPGLFGPSNGARGYYAALAAFVAVLTAVPLAGNLGAAWLLVEATTAASAILVGFSGKPRALEAGWKYLILTSLGLGVALLGIVLLAAVTTGGARPRSRGVAGLGHSPRGDDRSSRSSCSSSASRPRSAGRRCTTGCPTRTPRRRRRCRRCCPRRCCQRAARRVAHRARRSSPSWDRGTGRPC